MRGARGFTLIELIMVIVVASVLGMGVISFLGHSVEGYVDTAERQQMAMAGTSALEKISRDLRESLPNSINVYDNGNCLEFVPVLSGGRYPEGASEVTILAGRINQDQVNKGVYIAVYPLDVNEVYKPVNSGSIHSVSGDYDDKDDGTYKLEAADIPPAIGDSSTRRFFIVSTPKIYCVYGGVLRRYEREDFNGLSSANAETIGLKGDRVLDSIELPAGTGFFQYLGPSLRRNALIIMNLRMQVGGEVLNMQQQVAIRNVP